MAGLTVRRATLADQEGILDIDRLLFGGLDYMEAMYTVLLQDPNFRGYVTEADGQIVSAIYAYTIINMMHNFRELPSLII